MRLLQIVGLIIGLLIMLYVFLKRKQRRYDRTQAMLGMVVGLGLILVSVSLNVNQILARLLRMENGWNAVLFVSNLLLFFLFFYTLNQASHNRHTVNRLIRALAQQKLDRNLSATHEVLVLIPAYNEAENIGSVLRSIPSEVCDIPVNVLVAVDGGTDNTEEVARENGAMVIVNPINRGGGAALHAAYQVAQQRQSTFVVTLDADGQHRPDEMPRLVQPLINGDADFVAGSRVLGSQAGNTAIRNLGIVVFNWLITLLMGQTVTDASNAYRAFRTELLTDVNLQQNQFHTSELLIEVLKNGARYQEVPITIELRQSGETKKPRSLKYGWGFTKAIIGTWLR